MGKSWVNEPKFQALINALQEGQGFLWSRPVSAEKMLPYLGQKG